MNKISRVLLLCLALLVCTNMSALADPVKWSVPLDQYPNPWPQTPPPPSLTNSYGYNYPYAMYGYGPQSVGHYGQGNGSHYAHSQGQAQQGGYAQQAQAQQGTYAPQQGAYAPQPQTYQGGDSQRQSRNPFFQAPVPNHSYYHGQ